MRIDKATGKSFQLPRALPELFTLIDQAGDMEEIETLRNAMSMTQQMATAQDSEHTESEGDGDDSDDNSEPAVLGADELDKDEEMDDLETLMVALNDGSELPKG